MLDFIKYFQKIIDEANPGWINHQCLYTKQEVDTAIKMLINNNYQGFLQKSRKGGHFYIEVHPSRQYYVITFNSFEKGHRPTFISELTSDAKNFTQIESTKNLNK